MQYLRRNQTKYAVHKTSLTQFSDKIGKANHPNRVRRTAAHLNRSIIHAICCAEYSAAPIRAVIGTI